jgi:hypothetical protein
LTTPELLQFSALAGLWLGAGCTLLILLAAVLDESF